MNPVRLFVSHTSQYGNLAKSLRRSQLELKADSAMDVHIHEDMPGGQNWRKWIEESTQTAAGFVLLYPHEDMDMGWPNYEVARFFDSKGERDNKVVWIRNPSIKKLPTVFEPYQAYDASHDGIYKFFKEIFGDGMFSNGVPLNREVGVLTSSY
ncbi:MAG: hypothetical protein CPDRYMAC_3811 [uncultured Paraburkholderia sp.]|nr:MAG: hypothetical protein CPDRYDRY_3673 [uncultured Paraburkholderia sp.]CAH2933025.1 MAG: hypothetical protein CPDRYMAC_3811 [uncultured Paraburkholderia sp.]